MKLQALRRSLNPLLDRACRFPCCPITAGNSHGTSAEIPWSCRTASESSPKPGCELNFEVVSDGRILKQEQSYSVCNELVWACRRKTSESPNQIIQRWSRQTGDKCARETKRKMNTIRLHSDVVQLPKTLHCNVTYMLHDAGLTSLLHQRLSHLVKKGFPILGSERGETQLGL
ncbi:hypothetical protein M758_10G109500 [Ceratodon purpureus]|nr:hypothetical protein M758_10G109500 [Ceratodon purpureus]